MPRPSCNQLYNIFYSSHPSAMRIEPLLHVTFKHIMPVKIPEYQKYPYGDSAPIYACMKLLFMLIFLVTGHNVMNHHLILLTL